MIRTDAQQQGVAIVELAFSLVAILLVSFVGLEFSRSLDFSQGAVSLSRETTSRAFRDCIGMYEADSENDPAVADGVWACLEQVRASMERFARTSFPETEIIVSLFRYDNAAANCSGALDDDILRVSSADGSVAGKSMGGERAFMTRFVFDEPGSRGQTLHGGMNKHSLCMTRAVIISEVFVPYRAITGARAPLFTWNPEVFYNAALM